MSSLCEVENSTQFESPLREPDEFPNLSECERSKISSVMERAQKDAVENSQKMRIIEGYLQKWTNLMKGYQRRYLYLDPSSKLLQYFILKDHASQQPPRGSLTLKLAAVASLPDDPMGFEVTAANGDQFKLRANSSADRHSWVSAIQCAIDLNSPDNLSMLSNSIRGPSVSRKLNSRHSMSSASALFNGQCNNQDGAKARSVIEAVRNLEQINDKLTRLLNAPELGAQSPLYKDVLVLKSLSNSSLESVQKCAQHTRPLARKTSHGFLPKKNSNSLSDIGDSLFGNTHL